MFPLLLPAIIRKAVLDISNSPAAIHLFQYKLYFVGLLTHTYFTQQTSNAAFTVPLNYFQ